MHYLYKIVNQLDGKVYVGQTKNPEKRWREHRYISSKHTKQQYVHKALAKYGINNFKFEIIDFGLNQWHADCLEISYILQYDSRNQEKGYNFRPGGYVFEVSEETRQKISESKKGKPRPEEASKKSSKTMKEKCANGWIPATTFKSGSDATKYWQGKVSPRKGMKSSEETRKKISEAGKGRVPHNKGKGFMPTFEQLEEINKLKEQNISFTKIGKIIGVDRHIISSIINSL